MQLNSGYTISADGVALGGATQLQTVVYDPQLDVLWVDSNAGTVVAEYDSRTGTAQAQSVFTALQYASGAGVNEDAAFDIQRHIAYFSAINRTNPSGLTDNRGVIRVSMDMPVNSAGFVVLASTTCVSRFGVHLDTNTNILYAGCECLSPCNSPQLPSVAAVLYPDTASPVVQLIVPWSNCRSTGPVFPHMNSTLLLVLCNVGSGAYPGFTLQVYNLTTYGLLTSNNPVMTYNTSGCSSMNGGIYSGYLDAYIYHCGATISNLHIQPRAGGAVTLKATGCTTGGLGSIEYSESAGLAFVVCFASSGSLSTLYMLNVQTMTVTGVGHTRTASMQGRGVFFDGYTRLVISELTQVYLVNATCPGVAGYTTDQLTYPSLNYNWQVTSIGGCSVSCGGGIATANYSCVETYSGALVHPLYCNQSFTTRSTTVTCNVSPCPFSSSQTPFSSSQTPFSSSQTPFSSSQTPFSSSTVPATLTPTTATPTTTAAPMVPITTVDAYNTR